ncbi:hypothetical protein QR685DRAFT_531397 [Neurospora intermedia]|uniref:Uncharacterized protein n=1 Tax=Neurospora intermedia TaxID=5142 RepID=A0ABR3D551_NEUIN
MLYYDRPRKKKRFKIVWSCLSTPSVLGTFFTLNVFLLFFFCWLVRQWCPIWVFGLKIMVERGDEIMRYESAGKLKVKISSLLLRVCGVGIIAKGTQFHRGVVERATNILGTQNK